MKQIPYSGPTTNTRHSTQFGCPGDMLFRNVRNRLSSDASSHPRKTRVLNHNAVDSSWNVMAHGDARERKWRGNWQMEWVASTLQTTSEHCVSSITTTDAHTSAASSRLNWSPRRFKWTRPFRRKTKSGFCACAITFQLASKDLERSWQVTQIISLCASPTSSYSHFGKLWFLAARTCLKCHHIFFVSSW